MTEIVGEMEKFGSFVFMFLGAWPGFNEISAVRGGGVGGGVVVFGWVYVVLG